MKLPFALLLALVLPAAAAPPAATTSKPPPAPAKGKPAQRATTATKPGGTTEPSARQTASSAPKPTSAPTPAGGKLTLDAYIQALTDQLSLSKDEQKDIKTYYLDDGSTLNGILNDASLSPFEQTRQVDDLRNARNAKIEALLRDVDRQQGFLKTEAGYRVALTELAANGELFPTSPTPRVPEPTATAPAQAGKSS
jgi:hypothetical protein